MRAHFLDGPLAGTSMDVEWPTVLCPIPADPPKVPWWILGQLDIEDALPIEYIRYERVRTDGETWIMEVTT